MKLSAFFLFVLCLQVAARGDAQTVTLSVKDAPLEKVFQAVEAQTGYTFAYTGSQLAQAKKVTLEIKNGTLAQVLSICFRNQPLTYELIEKTIVVKQKTNPLSSEQLIFSSIDVHGKVINENEEPAPDITVSVKGESQRATTNDKGEFDLKGIDENAILRVEGISIVVQEIELNGRKDILIKVKTRITQLEDVKVEGNTGYQRISKERATGSFEVVSNKELNYQVGTNILDRLQGMAASVSFSEVGTQPRVTVRGLSTILGNKDPLIVVDDFPYSGDMSNINPNDVESITILKDAAASSIWGTRAGNGVIVITTKSAKSNSPLSVEFNANVISRVKPDLMYAKTISSSDYIDLEQFLYSKGYYTSSLNSNNIPAVSPVVDLLARRSAGQITQMQLDEQLSLLKSVDVRREFMDRLYSTAITQQYSINIKGGGARSTYLASLGYDTNIDYNDRKNDRLTVRLQNTFDITSKLKLNISGAFTKVNLVEGKPLYEGFRLSNLYPYTRLADDSGNALPMARGYRSSFTDTAGAGLLLDWNFYPLDDYKHTKRETSVNDLLLNLGLTYKLRNLTIDMKYQWENQLRLIENYQGLGSYTTRDLINRFSQVNYPGKTVKYIVPKGGIMDRSDNSLLSQSMRAQLTYNKNWQKNNLVAVAGTEVREAANISNGNRLYGYSSDLVTYSNMDFVNTYPTFVGGTPSLIPSGLSRSDKINRFLSFYGNLSYSYKSKYILSASARRDASNLFGLNTNDKWQPLWSTGAAWVINKESWYNSKNLPSLRLKATYGFSGNVDPSRTAVTTISYVGVNAPITGFPIAFISQYNNPDLRWEQVSTLNFGLEFETRNQVLTGSIEYYKKRGLDLFGTDVVDYTTGIGNRIIRNVANMKGSGFDFSVSTKNIDRAFKWNTNIIASINNSKVTKYFLTSERGSDYVGNGLTPTPMPGQPVYSIVGYKWIGLDTLGHPVGIVDGKSSTSYSDIVGTKTTTADLVYGGSALPTFFGSIQNSFSWKGLSINASVQFKLGHYFRRSSISYGQLFSQAVGHSDYGKRWRNPGDEKLTSVPSLVYPNVSARDQFYSNSALLIEKADHLRLQFVNVSYDLPRQVLKMIKMQSLQVYMNASNLGLLWRANKYNIDPDYGDNIPPSAAFAFGIRSKF